MAKADPHIVKVVGQPVPCYTHNIRSDNEASRRPSTVNLGGFYTPDTQRLGYGADGVGGAMGGGDAKKSQIGKAAPRRGRSSADAQT